VYGAKCIVLIRAGSAESETKEEVSVCVLAIPITRRVLEAVLGRDKRDTREDNDAAI
jgi:hypothetical protein